MESDLETAEAKCRTAHDLCKETLKKVEVLSRRKRVTDVQHARRSGRSSRTLC